MTLTPRIIVLKKYILIASALLAVPFSASAGQTTPYLAASTLGVSLGVHYAITPAFSMSAGVNSFSRDVELKEGGTPFSGEAQLESAELIAKWHPFKGNFYLAAGLLFNEGEVTAQATSSGNTFRFNKVNYPISNARAEFKARLDENGISPYVGLGYAIKPKAWYGLQLFADAGVIQHDFSTSLTFSGVTDPTGRLAQEAEEVRRDLEGELDKYRLYPVLRIGLGYSF